MMTDGALVIGGEYRGLGIVRSLGRRGIPVWVLTDEHLIAGTSRYARRHLPWPNADSDLQVRFLLALAKEHHLDGWAIFPTGDETAALVARHHEILAERFRLTTPTWEVFRWAYDKRLTHQLADEEMVDRPWTCYPAGAEDICRMSCEFPVILKPAVKTEFNAFTRAKAWQVNDHAGLAARYAAARRLVPEDVIMVQELVPGGGEAQFSYAALCRDGEPLASLTARRTRQYPIDFGRASTFVETVERPEIEGPARRLLRAIDFTGLIEIEFKFDRRTGQYKLLDLNPRIWGWHTLGLGLGIDFSFLLWQLIHGESVSAPTPRPGVRWVRMVTDGPAAIQEMRRGRLSFPEYLKSLRPPLELATFALDDPLPGLVEIPLFGRMAWKRGAV